MHNGDPLLVATKLGRPAAASTRHATVLRLALLVAVGLQGPAAPGQSGPDPPAEARFASAPTIGSHSPGSGPDESAEDLFAQLLDAVRADPQPSGPTTLAGGEHTRREVWASDVYASRRAKLLALGPAAEEVVARNTHPDAPLLARVIAGGLAYELSHHEQLVPFYEHLGRVVSGTRSFRGVSRRRHRYVGMMMEMEMGFREFDGEGRDPIERVYDYEEPTDLAGIGFRRFWSSWGGWTPSPARIPVPLRIEQAAAWPDDRRLRALADLTDHRLAFEVLQWVLLEEPDGPRPIMRDYRQPGPAAIWAMAEVGGARAIDVYRRHLEVRPAAHVETVIEALILIGDPRGAEVLEAIASPDTRSFSSSTFSSPTYRAAAADAQTVLPLLKDGPEQLVELLGAESASLRLRAAISLAGRGDLRAVPVLFEAAAAPPDLTTRRYWRPWEQSAEHQRSRDALVALGEPALPALREAAARSEAVHAALLAEVVTLHVERPELIERFHMAMRLRTPGFGSMLGPSLWDYRVTGWQVADLLGARATALLEAAIVWPPDSFQPRVAAFALARFRQERSIDILVMCAATIGGDTREGNVTVAALEAFGEAGIVAAGRLQAARERPPADQSRMLPEK